MANFVAKSPTDLPIRPDGTRSRAGCRPGRHRRVSRSGGSDQGVQVAELLGVAVALDDWPAAASLALIVALPPSAELAGEAG